MPGMLNYLIEGVTLAGMAINSALPQRLTWSYRHFKSLHPLCAMKLACPFTGRGSAGCVAYPRTPKASNSPSSCSKFWEQHECYSHSAPKAQAVRTGFTHCFATVFLFIHLIYKYHP